MRLHPALAIFFWSRAAIWIAAVLALLAVVPADDPLAGAPDPRLDELGFLLDVWARWDSGWFVQIAEDSYASEPDATPAFHPLYPGIVGVVGRALLGHYVLAGVIVSFVAAGCAFVLLWRLGRDRLGEDAARRAVLYLALFPTAVFLTAVYSESLYLALSIGAFLLAERSRFALAGTAAGLAMLTRFAGVALLPALAVYAWRAENRLRAFAGIAISLPVFAIFPAGLWLHLGEPFAFLRAQQEGWHRSLSPLGPLGGLWEGLVAGVNGIVQLVAGGNRFPELAEITQERAAALNVVYLAFALLYVALGVVAWRRLGPPYGVFVLASVALPLSAPADRLPLLSMPRFGLGIFSIFLALAVVSERAGVHRALLGGSALLLGVVVTQWSLGQWFA